MNEVNARHAGEPTREELLARIAELERKQTSGGVKLSASGGVSLYGNGKFPNTMYATGWIRTFQKQDEILDCMRKNFASLSFKTDEQRAEAAKFLGIEVAAE